MTAARIRIDSEGRIQGDEETLARLRNREFEVHGEAVGLTLVTAPRRLHEIEDVAERMQAYADLEKRLMRPGGEHLPTDWASIRDSIYD